jgi:hypothetical protein
MEARIKRAPSTGFCPACVSTKQGALVVNPYISNRQRAEVLGHNLFGHLWKADAARIMGINREALYSRLAKPDGDLDDAEINLLMAEARRRIKELETAAELCRLPPFIV